MFNFKQILQDIIAKVLAYGGTVLAGSGVATGEQTTAIIGGIAAAIGAIWTVITKHKNAKDIAIVAEAVDTKKTTAEVVASPTPVVPVGTATTKWEDTNKKNYSSR